MSESLETASIGPEPGPEVGTEARVGTLVADRYELQARLGRGGHATVYRAHDRLLRTDVALKIVHQEREPLRALSRLRREVNVARESDSPHLIRIFDVGMAGGIYLTMEVLGGGSLRERLMRRPLPVEEAVRVAAAILQGLAALHAKGVVHRDITPGNVLFTERGEVKVADFGLARRFGTNDSRLTMDGTLLGTWGYLSPEQLQGKDASPRSDLYAVGVVLFEMLAGRPPHQASSELGHHLATLAAAPDVRQFRSDTPRWLAEVVARLLERRPADRFPNAEAVLATLGRRAAPPRYRLRRHLLRAAAIALLFLPPAGVLVVPTRSAAFSHLAPAGETGIAAIGTSGEMLWKIEGVSPEIADRAAHARITPGGPRLLALVLARPGKWSPEAISTLSFLDPGSGRVVKEEKLPTGAELFPNDPPRFSFASAKAVDLTRDGVDEVLINYNHVPEAPFYTVLYSPRHDRARVVFYSRGGQDFRGATDLDGDGAPELLFVGINNGWNWVNVAAAVRLDPAFLTHDVLPSPCAPDVIEHPSQARQLLWYASLPRGHLQGPDPLTIDVKRRELTIHYLDGRIWRLAFDGFPPEASRPDRTARQHARRAAYNHLREAERLRRAGALTLAMSEAQATLAAARRARETWLSQYAERLQAKILVMEGRIPEAETRFSTLADRAEDAPEVAYDAAVAFHLAGDLPRAVAWYERGIGRESAVGAGKSKHEFLKGEVLALVEERRYPEALAAVARFGATYPSWQTNLWIYREYVRWRAGERPATDLAEVPSNWTDLTRYWALELALAAGGEPREILERVERFLAERPEIHAELLSLRAELFVRMGRAEEAAEVAQLALDRLHAMKAWSIVHRGHLALVEERAHRLGRKASS